ncbi:hypothetical protein GCM10010286_20110 [Streptomyces toxytricini]|nr:hypothetical protein GCM10010286_20110 [Streptomyces toxytricini]
MKTFPCRSVVPITVNAYVRPGRDPGADGAAAAGAAAAPVHATAAPVTADEPKNALRSNPIPNSLRDALTTLTTPTTRVDSDPSVTTGNTPSALRLPATPPPECQS